MLLGVYQSSEKQIQSIENFYNQLFLSVQALLSQAEHSPNSTKGALLICQAALVSIRDTKFLARIFTGLSMLMCKLIDDFVGFLAQNIVSLTQLNLN